MLRPPSRFGSLSALLAVVTTLSSAAGPAFARTKKKHPKHAPAAHQTKHHQGTQPATEEAPEPATHEDCGEPAGESGHPAAGGDHQGSQPDDRKAAKKKAVEKARPKQPAGPARRERFAARGERERG